MKKSIMHLMLLLVVVSSCAFPSMDIAPGVCYHNHNGEYLRCADFDFNYGNLKAISASKNEPFDFGHKRISLDVEGWEALINYLDKIYVWKEKNFSSKQKKKTPKKRTGGKDIIKFFKN